MERGNADDQETKSTSSRDGFGLAGTLKYSLPVNAFFFFLFFTNLYNLITYPTYTSIIESFPFHILLQIGRHGITGTTNKQLLKLWTSRFMTALK